MSGHLSSQRISLWMLGERAAEDQRHLGECPECAAELARLKAALSGFRGSVHQWAGRQTSSAPHREWAPARTAFWPGRFRWAAAAAIALLAALIPVYRIARHSHTAPAIAQSDAQLLEEVDAEVSRSVPQPMEPLLNLVAWGSDNSSNTTGKENHETQQQK